MAWMNRRTFIGSLGIGTAACLAAAAFWRHREKRTLLAFRRNERAWLYDPRTNESQPIPVECPNGVGRSWVVASIEDGCAAVVQALETRLDNGRDRSFYEFYHLTPTHTFRYEFSNARLTEILTQRRVSRHCEPCCLLPDGSGMLCSSTETGQTAETGHTSGHVIIEALEWSGLRKWFFKMDDDSLGAVLYGFTPSPDGKEVAFHVAGPAPHGYRVVVSNWHGENRQVIAEIPGHTVWCPAWSPDGQRILFTDMPPAGPADSEAATVLYMDRATRRNLVISRTQWCNARYGDPAHHGNGTNIASWFDNDSILISQMAPNSHSPWITKSTTDTDHFNSEFRRGTGGTNVVRVWTNSRSNELTKYSDGRWDFRPIRSPELGRVAFCRWDERRGGGSEIWIMNEDGTDQVCVGVGDHPRWIEALA